MQILSTRTDIQNFFEKTINKDKTLALVPTMGALHRGHLALVRHAQTLADAVVVTIFVNPLQFGPAEDFDRYPRTRQKDCEALAPLTIDAVYAPDVFDMYPQGPSLTRMTNTHMGSVLCGAHRAGHFDGVLTVVMKLYQRFCPHVMVFGEKDYQQYLMIHTMMRDLDVPVDIIGLPTQREEDGLALSSRNTYLSQNQRAIAPLLYQTLCQLQRELTLNPNDAQDILTHGQQRLHQGGFETVDYLEARTLNTLSPWQDPTTPGRLFVAAHLGGVRLIDNIAI
jgi:pantoate--beta-alanine ligase